MKSRYCFDSRVTSINRINKTKENKISSFEFYWFIQSTIYIIRNDSSIISPSILRLFPFKIRTKCKVTKRKMSFSRRNLGSRPTSIGRQQSCPYANNSNPELATPKNDVVSNIIPKVCIPHQLIIISNYFLVLVNENHSKIITTFVFK